MTLVLLHPVGLDGGCWQFCDLPGQRPDYPGHGGRPAPADGVLDFGRVADEIADRCTGPLDVVGLSIGSAVAQYLAVRHPYRVRSLLLACNGPAGAPRLDRAEETIRLGMAGTLDVTLRRWFTPAALAQPGHPGVRYARERLLADDPEGVAAIWAADRSLLTPEALGAITVPVTVLGGRQDQAATVPRVTEVFQALPSARLEIIQGPHMLQLERPREFSAAVRRHLAWADDELRKEGTRHR
jgi:pimeloyl-ACP methyl ester carboxylesterase